MTTTSAASQHPKPPQAAPNRGSDLAIGEAPTNPGTPESVVTYPKPPPLWLLDVDGVINAVCGTVPPGYERRRINGFQITWNPQVITRMRQLHETGAVEIRWLTTWCHDAANMIAPALGLPLDCAVEGAGDHLNTDHKTWWKSPAAKRLSDAEPGRALIWTDDDLDDAERNGEVTWLRERTGPTYAYAPVWRQGITPKSLAKIEAFIERVRTVAA